MIPIEAMCTLFDYNYWARDRQLEACATLSAEQLAQRLGGSFPSVGETLAHLVAVEWIWHQRWVGRLPNKNEFTEYTAATSADLATVRARWQAVESDMRAFLAGLTDTDLRKPFTYTNLSGKSCTYALWQMLLHVANHQTYHRGQVTTLLRQLGVAAPAVDFLVMEDARRTAAVGGRN